MRPAFFHPPGLSSLHYFKIRITAIICLLRDSSQRIKWSLAGQTVKIGISTKERMISCIKLDMLSLKKADKGL